MGAFRKFSALCVAAVVAQLAGQASAAVLTFNFNGNGGLQAGDSILFTSGGQSVTVTAGATALNNEFNINSRIGQYSQGLGNTTNYSYNYNTSEKVCVRYWANGSCRSYDWQQVTKTADVTDDSHEVDDWIEVNKSGSSNDHGVREYLKLDFGLLNVTLLNVDFGYHDDDDDTAQVKISNSSTQIYSGNADPITSGAFSPYSPTNMFWFIAGGDNYNNNDWKLKSVTISFELPDGGPDPREVPVPAALSLLGLGLAGLAVTRRRRRG